MAVPNVTTDDTKHDIIRRFNENVRGKQAETTNSNQRHDGREGHWLERQMGLTANASNAPDLHGYEMKNQTTAKTTFGDWSADYYIYKDVDFGITRNQFLMIFGKPNSAKGGRYSWSGEPCPKINRFNSFGQKLYIDANHNIIVEYSFAHDERPDKTAIVPLALQREQLILAKWYAHSISQKLERKFNQRGWFKCLKNQDNVYTTIVFGDPISFERWIALVETGEVFFDSGMYQTNARNYSVWRSTNTFWDSLITSSY